MFKSALPGRIGLVCDSLGKGRTPFTANRIPQNRLSQQALNILALVPKPNAFDPGGSPFRNNFVGWNGFAGFYPKHDDHDVEQNNPIVMNLNYGIMSGDSNNGTYGTGYSSSYHHTIVDNLLYDNARGQDIASPDNTNGPTIDWQLYSNHGATTRLFSGWSTLTDVRANTPYEDHAVLADPMFVSPATGDFTLQAGSPAKGTASTGADRGAQAAAVTGVGPDGSYSLAHVPMFNELGLTVTSWSSQTTGHEATRLVDRDQSTEWVPQTTANEWVVFDLPGTTPVALTRLTILRPEHQSANQPKDFRVYVQPTAGAAWTEITSPADPFVAYSGGAGRTWKLPANTSGVAVKLVLVDNYGGSYIEAGEVRLYGVGGP